MATLTRCQTVHALHMPAFQSPPSSSAALQNGSATMTCAIPAATSTLTGLLHVPKAHCRALAASCYTATILECDTVSASLKGWTLSLSALCAAESSRSQTAHALHASFSISDTVICCAAGRECDPDLCAPCRHTTNAPNTKPDGAMDCLNMPLRLRQHKRVAMGISQVAGWGAFAMVSRLGALQLLQCICGQSSGKRPWALLRMCGGGPCHAEAAQRQSCRCGFLADVMASTSRLVGCSVGIYTVGKRIAARTQRASAATLRLV